MRAECEYGHPRRPMLQDHLRKRFFCDECGKEIAPERIWNAADDRYRNLPLSVSLPQLDYEIVGVITAAGDLLIEYPRMQIS